MPIEGNDWKAEVQTIGQDKDAIRKDFYEKRETLKGAVGENINGLTMPDTAITKTGGYLFGVLKAEFGVKKAYKILAIASSRGIDHQRDFNVDDFAAGSTASIEKEADGGYLIKKDSTGKVLEKVKLYAFSQKTTGATTTAEEPPTKMTREEGLRKKLLVETPGGKVVPADGYDWVDEKDKNSLDVKKVAPSTVDTEKVTEVNEAVKAVTKIANEKGWTVLTSETNSSRGVIQVQDPNKAGPYTIERTKKHNWRVDGESHDYVGAEGAFKALISKKYIDSFITRSIQKVKDEDPDYEDGTSPDNPFYLKNGEIYFAESWGEDDDLEWNPPYSDPNFADPNKVLAMLKEAFEKATQAEQVGTTPSATPAPAPAPSETTSPVAPVASPEPITSSESNKSEKKILPDGTVEEGIFYPDGSFKGSIHYSDGRTQYGEWYKDGKTKKIVSIDSSDHVLFLNRSKEDAESTMEKGHLIDERPFFGEVDGDGVPILGDFMDWDQESLGFKEESVRAETLQAVPLSENPEEQEKQVMHVRWSLKTELGIKGITEWEEGNDYPDIWKNLPGIIKGVRKACEDPATNASLKETYIILGKAGTLDDDDSGLVTVNYGKNSETSIQIDYDDGAETIAQDIIENAKKLEKKAEEETAPASVPTSTPPTEEVPASTPETLLAALSTEADPEKIKNGVENVLKALATELGIRWIQGWDNTEYDYTDLRTHLPQVIEGVRTACTNATTKEILKTTRVILGRQDSIDDEDAGITVSKESHVNILIDYNESAQEISEVIQESAEKLARKAEVEEMLEGLNQEHDTKLQLFPYQRELNNYDYDEILGNEDNLKTALNKSTESATEPFKNHLKETIIYLGANSVWYADDWVNGKEKTIVIDYDDEPEDIAESITKHMKELYPELADGQAPTAPETTTNEPDSENFLQKPLTENPEDQEKQIEHVLNSLAKELEIHGITTWVGDNDYPDIWEHLPGIIEGIRKACGNETAKKHLKKTQIILGLPDPIDDYDSELRVTEASELLIQIDYDESAEEITKDILEMTERLENGEKVKAMLKKLNEKHGTSLVLWGYESNWNEYDYPEILEQEDQLEKALTMVKEKATDKFSTLLKATTIVLSSEDESNAEKKWFSLDYDQDAEDIADDIIKGMKETYSELAKEPAPTKPTPAPAAAPSEPRPLPPGAFTPPTP